ncbi:MAG: DNA cytosine methyltransferase [Rhizomicrobium sp.]
MNDLTAIDLFAGGGGLTVGLKRAGFEVAAAVELDDSAYDTYIANHRDVRAYKQDIRTICGRDLVPGDHQAVIDLISGCPPCQGFTSLTAKYKKSDPRNALINDMLRIVGELSPRAVMMENVPGLLIRGKRRFQKFKKSLEAMGYVVSYGVLQAADYGVPQYRRRLVLLAGLGFEIPLPAATHSKDGKDGLKKYNTVRDTISSMSVPVHFSDLRERKISPAKTDWHIIRTLTPENMARMRAARVGQQWWKIPSKLRPNCHKGRSYRGFGSVYGRMRWADASPTITGGCTTFSKGRFGHPQANRTISVREAAMLQTFPKDYVLDTSSIEDACNIVGNALPCLFAEVLARQCKKYLKANQTPSISRKKKRQR